MRVLDLCSGISAATVAWQTLGWTSLAFAEIDPFACAVLAHHYPGVPNYGDIRNYPEWPDAAVDVLMGGTPCQSFSVAGQRAGLDDPRGDLALVWLAAARHHAARWLVWENVPGVLSSNGGRDFGAFLGTLAQLGYGFAWRVLDAQFFGLAQRRRRVFVIGCAGNPAAASAVLFERASLLGHPAPRRETRQDLTPTLAARTRSGGGFGTDNDCDGGLIPGVARALTGSNERIDAETETLLVTHALSADGFDASEDGTGRGTPLVPAYGIRTGNTSSKGCGIQTDVTHALDTSTGLAIAFDCKASARNSPTPGELTPTLRAMPHADSHANGGGQLAVAFAQNQRDETRL
ncbi:DNA cytosine methyltransferase, partial [Burkholderia territorii]